MNPANNINYKNLFASITTSVLVTDSSLKILFFNNPTLGLFNLEKKDLDSQNLEKLFYFSGMEKQSMSKHIKNSKPLHLIKECKSLNSECRLRLDIKPLDIPMESETLYFFEISPYQTQNLSSEDIIRIGKKTAQVAHSLSNPLSVLKIHCDNFAAKAKKTPQVPSSEILERVQKLLHVSQRLNLHTDELKKMAKLLTSNNLESIINFFEEADTGDDSFDH